MQTAADTGTLGSQGSRVEKKKITHGRKPSTVLAELDVSNDLVQVVHSHSLSLSDHGFVVVGTTEN